MAMAYSLLISTVTSMIINSWPNRELLNYSFSEQIIDILPSTAIAILMGILISPIRLLNDSIFVTLLIQILLGMVIYIGLSIVFKLESFEYLWQMVKSFLKR